MPRFVVLCHQPPPDGTVEVHWDWMLEHDGVLRTWALTEEPRPDVSIPATALPDHRLAYLDYEGPVSRNRGEVTRCDQGTYRTLEQSLETIVVLLEGSRYRGRVTLRRCGEHPQGWLFSLSSERPASSG